MNQPLLTTASPTLPVSCVWLLLLLVMGLLIGVLLVTGQLLRHFRQLLPLPTPEAAPEPAVASATAPEEPAAASAAATAPEPAYPPPTEMAVLLETATQA